MSHTNTQEQQRLDQIAFNLSQADFVLRQAEYLTESVLRLFEIETDSAILRLRAETPDCFDTAASWLAAGRQYVDGIDSTCAEEANVHRSARAMIVAGLIEARVKATLARAYVKYWQGAKALNDYGVLAHQAIAYAEACCGDNWTYFAPLAFIRAEEPLIEESDSDIRLLARYGEAAFAYATCLHAQMHVSPARLLPPEFEPVKVPKPEGEKQPMKPAELPRINAGNLNRQGVTQSSIARCHRSITRENLHEDYRWGISRRSGIYLKRRLVGFERSRGGKNHTKSKSSAA